MLTALRSKIKQSKRVPECGGKEGDVANLENDQGVL